MSGSGAAAAGERLVFRCRCSMVRLPVQPPYIVWRGECCLAAQPAVASPPPSHTSPIRSEVPTQLAEYC